MAKLKQILEFDFEDYDENTQIKLCLEVPCVVNLYHGNVISWFERQVQKKSERKQKWKVYKDKRRLLKFLEEKGAFLYQKYLNNRISELKLHNRQKLRSFVWQEFVKQQLELTTQSSELTNFDSAELLKNYLDFETHCSPLSLSPEESLIPFEYDDCGFITSTQN